MEIEERYMRRALQLAARSKYDTHPNPCVGAVIVADGRIIGEGCHRRCGEGHAEVNAVASVKEPELLKDATMYVTLEPCSHYGKTPPCAKLIIDKKIPRVVVGAVDPFEKVSGRGINMLREAGVEVVSGVLAEESRELNRRFFTAHIRRRPYITLKWAMSADGFMDRKRDTGQPAARFSNELTTMLTHRERSLHDAILTSAATVLADNPSMTVRQWSGPNPQRVVIDRRGILGNSHKIFSDADKPVLVYDSSIEEVLADLYSKGITSVLVEAGPRLLNAFIDADLWDTIRVETSPEPLGDEGAHPAPVLPPTAILQSSSTHKSNTLNIYSHK